MNAKHLMTAVAAFALAGSALAAGNTEYVDFSNVQSVKTRAEVRAELEQAYRQGALSQSEYVQFDRVASSRSRDDVRTEALQAARNT
ncbi:MAG TPA: DUF4148 domain-containing protein [Noviherbaspirillum sp.]|uniref:DUF4148 domain-containing protein n=1 Tax=Noviherbaspirillum sp. TaxID=1926288 RepID=UPI002B477FAF|nr:DUF4148 domain-containing protein [Noviherbaspirillum sp.]HJV88019.1 DUF4148 domain-containing protein [Noviherbaspirillum sp.]